MAGADATVTPVVIMAGGRGLRLHPITETTPKPLVRVGNKPMLESVIGGFAAQGFRRFLLCVHYKADLIEGYFGNGEKLGVKIRYVHEKEPLGTGGALRFLPGFDAPFIVSNADVLAEIDYPRLMEHHARSNKRATVCLGLHQTQVPFGVCETDEHGTLTAMREKPIESWAVNAGVYVLEPSALESAPEGKFDLPELIDALRPEVSTYPIDGYWYDVGHWEALARANAEMAA